MHHDNPIIKRRMYIAGLGGSLLMSVVMLLMTFIGIAPNLGTQIAMGTMAFIVGFFGVQGLLSGNGLGLTVCILFSAVEVFSHTSLGLVSMHVQSKAVQELEASGGKDPEYERLVKRQEELDATAKELALAVVGMKEGFRSEVDIRQNGVNEANAKAQAASDAVTAYLEAKKANPEAGRVFDHEVVIDSNNFFTAIPDAISSGNPGRIIAFFMYAALFSGIVLTSLMTAVGLMNMYQKPPEVVEEVVEVTTEDEEVKRNGRTPGIRREIPKKTILAWVNTYWADHTSGVADKLVARPLARKALDDSGVKVTDNWDQKLYTTTKTLGLVGPDGKIQVPVIEARKRIDAAMMKEGA